MKGFHTGGAELLFSAWTDCEVPGCSESMSVFRFHGTKQNFPFMPIFFFTEKRLSRLMAFCFYLKILIYLLVSDNRLKPKHVFTC